MQYIIAFTMMSILLVDVHGLDIVEAGFRGGLTAQTKNEHVQQYEIYAAWLLPWEWQSDSEWKGNVRLNASAGSVFGGGIIGFVGSVGPSLNISTLKGRISTDVGLGVTLLSEDKIGAFNLGTPLQFTGHLGFKLRLNQEVYFGYRIQHMSNGGLDERNPGINLHMFELSRHF